MKKITALTLALLLSVMSFSQKKILFDATHGESASNADWVIDADSWDLDGEANPQRFPTPDQSGITASTPEDYWTGALSAWGVDAVKAGFYVETLPYGADISYGNSSNPQDLSHYSMFVVCEPNNPFSSTEKEAIIKFVENGGILFMIADHDGADRDGDGWDAVEIWNDLEENNPIKYNPFGITFSGDIDDSGSNIKYPDDPVIVGPYGTVTKVEFYGGSTITIDPSANSSVKGIIYRDGYSTSNNDNIMVATATYGKGYVFAIGDSSPIDDGTGDNNDNLYDGWLEDADGNHRILIMNATTWALSTFSPVENPAQENNIKIITNKNTVTFTSSPEISGTISIYDLSGHKLVNDNFGKGYYSISGLSEGIYIVKIIDANGNFYTEKFVLW